MVTLTLTILTNCVLVPWAVASMTSTFLSSAEMARGTAARRRAASRKVLKPSLRALECEWLRCGIACAFEKARRMTESGAQENGRFRVRELKNVKFRLARPETKPGERPCGCTAIAATKMEGLRPDACLVISRLGLVGQRRCFGDGGRSERTAQSPQEMKGGRLKKKKTHATTACGGPPRVLPPAAAQVIVTGTSSSEGNR